MEIERVRWDCCVLEFKVVFNWNNNNINNNKSK